ncbi:MAG TPA: hypothetical protein VK466_17345 [Terriglobales bacterium]|nr:hypothetical protein [Terriglobales bacterium]
MSTPVPRRWDEDTALLVVLAGLASVISFLIYFRKGDLLLFGDAVAHINIARRIFDSRTPGLLQLGTVWLPLPHLLMLPFVLANGAWQTGIGGSLPSMAAYTFALPGIFRLVRVAGLGRTTAWLAAAFFGLNPNLLYLQATAMTEALYLALFVWSLVYFGEFLRDPGATRWLWRCGACLFCSSLARYDGWFAAGVLGAMVVLLAVTRGQIHGKSVTLFLLLAWSGPLLWLTYNAVVYKNALEFANGPYSAKAIEKKAEVPGFPAHPGTDNLRVAAAYFLKAGQLNVAEGNWGRWWLGLAVVGSLACLVRAHVDGPPQRTQAYPSRILLLLWLPVPFYMLSVAHGGVPIFTPVWWPFSLYNVRYGVQLLPGLTVFVAVAVQWAASLGSTKWTRSAVVAAGAACVIASYAGAWRAQPVCYREAWVNSRTRLQLERSVAEQLTRLPATASLLMYSGEHVGVLQQAGIPLARTINEGNHRAWVRPSDPDGLWERALADPGKYADFAVAFEGDPVWKALHDRGLPALTIIAVNGQKRATIYQTRPLPKLSLVTTRVNQPVTATAETAFLWR